MQHDTLRPPHARDQQREHDAHQQPPDPFRSANDNQPSTRQSATADWVKAHETLTALARERCSFDGREASSLLHALRSGVHRHLGYGSFFEYIERLFGYRPRTTEDKLRTAEALETLPQLQLSLQQGHTNWSVARELTRVATRDTERDWLAAAQGRTVREVEQLVSGREPGDRPGDASRPEAQRHVLRFEVNPETLATFREALKKLRQDSGEPLDDDSALLSMARQVLGSQVLGSQALEGQALGSQVSTDQGRSAYQICVTTCERCGRGFQQAGNESVEIAPAIVEMVRCDAQYVGRVEISPTHLDDPLPMPHPPLHERERLASRATNTPAHTAPARAHDPILSTHVGDPPPMPRPPMPHPPMPHPPMRNEAAKVERATQTIPPALRRQILRRDGGRCTVPGCRHATFVDLHHIQPRSGGGRHEPDNLVVLCSAHHRAVHTGRLSISGRASNGLQFRHADGTPYGSVASPQAVAMLELVFRGLRGLGFGEPEARQALARAQAQSGLEPATASDLLRSALRLLTTASATTSHSTH